MTACSANQEGGDEADVDSNLRATSVVRSCADHISGFATNKSKTGTGDIIAGLEPQLVIQPWTERPDAPKDFIGSDGSMKAANDALRLSLARMSAVAGAASREARHLAASVRSEIQFVAADGVSNMSAVKNLAKMGKKTKAAYVQYGSKVAALKTLLPGIKVSILGPPTIKQKADVLNQDPVNRKAWAATLPASYFGRFG